MSEPATVSTEALKSAGLIPDLLPDTSTSSLLVLPMAYQSDV